MTAMSPVRLATTADLDDLVHLGAQLFTEDAAVHDTHIDLTWSEREGRDDFVRLLDEPSALVLIAAFNEAGAVGHLVAYTSASSPTRLPVTFATLRSMYVMPHYRHQGIGQLLVQDFVSWARDKGCVQAHVSSYVGNDRAQDFYQRQGFEALSVSRTLNL